MRSMIHRAAASLLQQCTFRGAHAPWTCRAYRANGARLGNFPYAAANVLPATFGKSCIPCASDVRLCSSSSSDDEELFDTSIRPYEKLDVPRTYIVRKKGHDVISGVFNFRLPERWDLLYESMLAVTTCGRSLAWPGLGTGSVSISVCCSATRVPIIPLQIDE